MNTKEAWAAFKAQHAALKTGMGICDRCAYPCECECMEMVGDLLLCNTCADTERERAVSCD